MGQLSFRKFGRKFGRDLSAHVGLLQERRVDDLRHLPGRQSMAQPGGWDRAAATHFTADAGSSIALVAGWEENCFYGYAPRQVAEDLSGLCRWRRTPATDAGGAPRSRSVLVAGWRHASLWQRQYPGKESDLPARSTDWTGFAVAQR